MLGALAWLSDPLKVVRMCINRWIDSWALTSTVQLFRLLVVVVVVVGWLMNGCWLLVGMRTKFK